MEFAERPTRMAYICRYQGLGHVLNLDFPPFEIIEESARAPAVVTDRPRVIALAGQHGLERGDQFFIGFQHHRPLCWSKDHKGRRKIMRSKARTEFAEFLDVHAPSRRSFPLSPPRDYPASCRSTAIPPTRRLPGTMAVQSSSRFALHIRDASS